MVIEFKIDQKVFYSSKRCEVYDFWMSLPMSTDPDLENWSDLEIGCMVVMRTLVRTLKKKPNSSLKLNWAPADLTMWIALAGPSEGLSGRQDLDWAYRLVSLSVDYNRTRLNLPLEVVRHQFAFSNVHDDLKTRPEFWINSGNILPVIFFFGNFRIVFYWEITEIEINLVRQSDSTSIKKELKSITKFVPNGFWHFVLE